MASPALAPILKLVDKWAAAAVDKRTGREAEVLREAVALSFASYGACSLVTVQLRLNLASSLQLLADATLDNKEHKSLSKEWVDLISEDVLPVLMLRWDDGTLLPGRCEHDEVEFNCHLIRSASKNTGQFRGSATSQRNAAAFMAPLVGYGALCCAAHLVLMMVTAHLSDGQPMFPEGPLLTRLREFVFLAIDAVKPCTAGCANVVIGGVRGCSTSLSDEFNLVDVIEQSLAQPNLDPTFRATLLKKWHDSGAQASITSRWVCSESSDVRRNARVMEGRARADAAAHGFRACALPSCAKVETSVHAYKARSACKAVVYCSEEHGALHWTQGHKKECAVLKAAGAKPPRAK